MMNFFKKYRFIGIIFLLLNQFILFESSKQLAYSETLSDKSLSKYIRTVPDDSFYILGSGDCFFLKVSKYANDLTNNFCIDGEGVSYLPRLKKIYISGLTVSELIDVLNKEYKSYVNLPDVEITITTYRPVNVYVDGEVYAPGLYTLKGVFNPLLEKRDVEDFTFRDISGSYNSYQNSAIQRSLIDNNKKAYNIFFPSITDAIRTSGGVTQNSDLRNVEITRVNKYSDGGGKIKTNVNLINTLDLKDTSQNIRILDGDTIFIPKTDVPISSQISQAMKSNINPKFIKVMVTGRVTQPGELNVPLTVSGFSTLTDALDIAGGKKIISGPVNFLRYNSDGTVDKRRFNYKRKAKRGSYINPYLRNGDIVYVGNSLLNVASEAITDITSPFVNMFSAYTFYKVFTND